LSGLSLQKHYQLGQLIAATAAKLNRRVVFIASGDLSHKLKRSGPLRL
jgi:aromatic ring-opening dioxygenase LigB subunit